jgi:hypothetical protein
MEKDETKTTAAEQPENTQSVETVETPDTQSTSGEDLERPDTQSTSGEDLERPDPPRDGEGCEAVTVIVAETSADHPEYAKIVARSVKANLVGADALVLIMAFSPEMTLAQALLRVLNEAMSTERIVLMTDHMVLLNPTTLCELGCRRGVLTSKGVTVGECQTPKLMYRSVLLKMLPEFIETYASFDVFLEYDEYARPNVMPVIMRPWNQDNWVMLVASDNPKPELLSQWAATQRFMSIIRPEWPRSVVRLLQERFPE